MNIFFILFTITTIILISISTFYGGLEIIALIFAIIALFPFVTSLFTYYWFAPKFTYQIGAKEKRHEDNFIYEVTIVITCTASQLILKKLFIAGSDGYTPKPNFKDKGHIEYKLLLGEVGFLPTLSINLSTPVLFSTTGFAIPIFFESSEDIKSIPIKIILDVGIDPMKLGVFSILPINFNYRCFADAFIDYGFQGRQEGHFERYSWDIS